MALLINSNTYIDLADAEAYFTSRLYSTAWTGSNKEGALILAAKHLDMMYEWLGTPVDTAQLMAWPRKGLYTRNGAEIDGSSVPVDIKNAQCELAYQWIQSDQLSPGGVDFTASDPNIINGGVQRQKLGPMEVEYNEQRPLGSPFAASDRARLRKIYPLVDMLVKPYVGAVAGSIFREIRQ